MSRKNIYEILERKNLEPDVAFSRLRYQFDHALHIIDNLYPVHSSTIKDIIDKYIFNLLPIRGSCINIDDLLNDLEIYLNGGEKTFDDVFCLAEFILCAYDSVPKSRMYKFKEYGGGIVFDEILYTINEILDATSHKIIKNKFGHRIIIQKDSKAELAASLVEQDEISFEVLQYNHYSNNGNINEKKRILKILSDYIEPYLNKRDDNLVIDTRFLLNNFDIRHNNRVGKNKNDYVINMRADELEEWYDKTYIAMMAIIINNELSSLHSDLKKFRK